MTQRQSEVWRGPFADYDFPSVQILSISVRNVNPFFRPNDGDLPPRRRELFRRATEPER